MRENTIRRITSGESIGVGTPPLPSRQTKIHESTIEFKISKKGESRNKVQHSSSSYIGGSGNGRGGNMSNMSNISNISNIQQTSRLLIHREKPPDIAHFWEPRKSHGLYSNYRGGGGNMGNMGNMGNIRTGITSDVFSPVYSPHQYSIEKGRSGGNLTPTLVASKIHPLSSMPSERVQNNYPNLGAKASTRDAQYVPHPIRGNGSKSPILTSTLEPQMVMAQKRSFGMGTNLVGGQSTLETSNEFHPNMKPLHKAENENTVRSILRHKYVEGHHDLQTNTDQSEILNKDSSSHQQSGIKNYLRALREGIENNTSITNSHRSRSMAKLRGITTMSGMDKLPKVAMRGRKHPRNYVLGISGGSNEGSINPNSKPIKSAANRLYLSLRHIISNISAIPTDLHSTPSIYRLNKVMDVFTRLRCDKDNPLTEILNFLQEEMDGFIYCPMHKYPTTFLLSEHGELNKGPEGEGNLEPSIPYFNMIQRMEISLKQCKTDSGNTQTHLDTRITDLEKAVVAKDKEIEGLEQALHFEKERNYLSKERKVAVETTQQKKETNLQKQIRDLSKSVILLEDHLDSTRTELEKEVSKSERITNVLVQREEEYLFLKNKWEKFEKNMKVMEEMWGNMQKDSRDRATASGKEELTPRYKYMELAFEELEINKPSATENSGGVMYAHSTEYIRLLIQEVRRGRRELQEYKEGIKQNMGKKKKEKPGKSRSTSGIGGTKVGDRVQNVLDKQLG